MRKKRGNGGFTLAELLIVVAIIGVLSGVAVVAVQSHEKSITQLERDTIAKEIFIAAQNHLTVAKAQDYNKELVEGTDAYNTYFGAATEYKTIITETDSEGKTTEKEESASGVHYLVGGSGLTNNVNALELMLPFGSIDDTVRTGGNYIIIYQPRTGVVLDVFYWETSGRYGGEVGDYTDIMGLRGAEKKQARLSNRPMIGWFGGGEALKTGAFLETPSIEVINAEKLIVRVTDKNVISANEDITAMQPMLKLIITGKSSGARLAFTLTNTDSTFGSLGVLQPDKIQVGSTTRVLTPDTSVSNVVTYDIVLDDITSKDMRFAQLNQLNDTVQDGCMKHAWDKTVSTTPQFTPGEDITVQAVAYSNTALSSVAYSGEWTTNSLFGGLRTNSDNSVTALVSNIRHLENLDEKVSALDNSSNARFAGVEQTVNLDWADFAGKFGGTSPSIYSYGKDEGGNDAVYVTKPGCYMPVSPSYALIYNGQSEMTNETTGNTEKVIHSLSKVAVADSGFTPPTGTSAVPIPAGGMFGTLVAGSGVSNLELVDFSVSLASTNDPGNAGALAGTITDTTVTNVVAHNSSGITGETDNRKISASGAVGGLIGMMKQNSGKTCKVEKSAAALIVSSTGGNAGGLIGTADGGTVSACYSGGHTVDKKDEDDNIIGILYDKDNYNVTTSNGIAGGLIGDAGATEVKYSYSTCSVKGTAAAGGLLGKSTAVKEKVENCYATGLVYESKSAEAKEGALVGILTNEDALKNCKYFEIINEREDETNGGFKYLAPIGSNTSFSNSEGTVIAFDESADKYNAFVDEPLKWTPSVTYDGKSNDDDKDDWLDIYYGKKYNLQNIKRLGGEILDEPKTETTANGTVTTPADFVATHYGDWPAPEIFVVNEQG